MRIASPSTIFAIATTLAAIAIQVVQPAWLGDATPVAAIVLFTIGFYATGVIPEFITALIFFTVAMIFAVAPAEVVFSGFLSTAFWLVFSGLILGLGINKSGLGTRIARRLSALFPSSFLGIICGTVTVGFLLAFIMPSSMGRVVLLMPIILTLADRLGFERGSRGRIAMALSAGFATFNAPVGILPAVVPNMVMVGAMEKVFDLTPLYGEWLLRFFPFLGLGKAVVIVLATLVVFREVRTKQQDEAQTQEKGDDPMPAMSQAEKRLGIILALALGGWASDFIHGISPSWIGMAAASACLLPGFGILAAEDFRKINFASAIYVAGILALGALIAESGLGALLGTELAELLPLTPGDSIANFLSLGIGNTLVALGTTIPGQPAVMVPLADILAIAADLPLDSVLALIVLGYSTTILPYQAPPIVVAMQLSDAGLADVTKLVLLVAALSFVLLYPATFFWWSALGLL